MHIQRDNINWLFGGRCWDASFNDVHLHCVESFLNTSPKSKFGQEKWEPIEVQKVSNLEVYEYLIHNDNIALHMYSHYSSVIVKFWPDIPEVSQ